MSWLIGIDVGGTFTDFFAYDEKARSVRLYKVPSTPDNPAAGITAGLQEMSRDFGIALHRIGRLSHGTTVATNALIQGKGGKVAVITTRGFRDLLEIGRQTRPHLYSLQIDRPRPVVDRQLRFEVDERITHGPRVVEPLNEASVDKAVSAVVQAGAESCAVCLLFSFLDSSHERRIGEALAKAGNGLFISLSSEVQPEFREYERFSTAVLNAYLQPVMARYLSLLEEHLKRETPKAQIGIYQSSGGLMSIDTARRFPVRTALSGPAAGAIGAIHSARTAKRPNIITLDMGGTSADVALIRNYEAGIGFDREVSGFPVRLPMIDINTVGAGGGSIAWFDRDGLLKVGPLSAGADPGPACYGKKGTEPTVTDANLVLGRLSAKGLIGGRMPLDEAAAAAAIGPTADRLGFSVPQTALGIIDITVANMVRAIRTISVERGHDPREYCLLAFGGAGPLHASQVARSLGMREVLVPPAPGILCAQGLIASDLKDDFVRSARVALDDSSIAALRQQIESLMEEADAWFARERVSRAQRTVKLSFDMRFVGQNFELPVLVGRATGGRHPKIIATNTLIQRFYDVHDQFYGFHNDSDGVEVVNIRLTASAAINRLESIEAPRRRSGVPQPIGHRQVWFRDGPLQTPVHDRALLLPGQRIDGPAIVEQFDSTTVLHPNDRLAVDAGLNLIIGVSQ